MIEITTKKISVLLVLEGSYPYGGGGISTWTHALTHRVSNASFILYSVNANLEGKSRFELSKNIEQVIQVPLWAPEEPHDYLNYGNKYYKVVLKKERTEEEIIKKQFVPIFKRFLDVIFNENANIEQIDKVFYDLWSFFQTYDYKLTLNSRPVWECYREKIIEITEDNFEFSLEDLNIGLAWLYRFLIPISIDVPKADISHITLSGFPLMPALVLKYKYNTPLIITEHGVFIRERLIAINSSEYSFFLKTLLIKFSESVTRLAYYKADLILSVNKFNNIWEKIYGASPEKIKVIYNGVDHHLFAPGPKPDHLKDIPTVVAAARIFELKDIITMIESCDIVRKTIPNVKYLVYGNKTDVPEYTAKCEELIEKLHLQDNFILAGQHNQPQKIFHQGDISILTSISEGFPYTVIESMSAGTPVVATDVGGVSEALDEKSGRLCKPKDAENIAAGVIELLSNDKLREAMGKYAREQVIKRFTIDNFIKGYEAAYASLCEN